MQPAFLPSAPLFRRSTDSLRKTPPRRALPRARIGSRALGVDYGLRRIGLAVSVGVAPRALPRVEHRANPAHAAAAVAAAAERTVSRTIVVGMPVDARGREGVQVRATRAFVDHLVVAAPWARVVTLDERYTTLEARETLKEAGVPREEVPLLLDGAAAVVLLNRFFGGEGEEQAVIVQEGVGEVVREKEAVEVVSFAQWKRDAMDRARENAKDKGKPRR